MKWNRDKSLLILQVLTELSFLALIITLIGSSISEKLSMFGITFQIEINRMVPDEGRTVILILILFLFLLLYWTLNNSFNSFMPNKRKTNSPTRFIILERDNQGKVKRNEQIEV